MRVSAIAWTTDAPRALVLSSALLSVAALSAPQAYAKDVYLAAVRTCVDTAGKNAGNCVLSSPPGPTDPVPVWSFLTITPAEYTSKTLSTTSVTNAVVPGPLLTADSSDSSGLTVHLLNLLPVPVSLVIPGQPAALNPTWFNPATGSLTGTGARPAGDVTSRVRSLNTEVAPGGTGDMTWKTLIPGSFIYESGTHQAIQVQMGLHGGLVVANGITTPGESIGTAYPGISYTRQVVTYLSEIDAGMHWTIDTSPTHDATPAGAASVSPLEYSPNMFLTNQLVLQPDFTPVAAAGGHGQILPNVPTLMRFMNASLRSHVQIVQNEYLSLMAEDGHPYLYPKNQYSVLLEAGKVKDALLTPAVAETVAVYDRMLNTGGGGVTKQGMIAYLDIGASPIATNNAYVTQQGVTLTVLDPGVLGNAVSPDNGVMTAKVGTTTAHGTLKLTTGGGFTYTPTTGSTATSDAFTYTAVEAMNSSKPATVTITLTPASPVASPDTYTVLNNATLSVAKPGVLGNDRPNTGLTATLVSGPAHGSMTLRPDGSFVYTANQGFVGADTFSYAAVNGTLKSAPATDTINVVAPRPVALNDYFTVKNGTSGNILNVIANDSGWVAGDALTIVSKPNRGGTAVPNADGTVTYTPKALFVGTDTFTYQVSAAKGVVSSVATVTVNVTR